MSYYDQMGREDQDQGKTLQALKRFQEWNSAFRKATSPNWRTTRSWYAARCSRVTR